jgi:hypothetical protein
MVESSDVFIITNINVVIDLSISCTIAYILQWQREEVRVTILSMTKLLVLHLSSPFLHQHAHMWVLFVW